jgi:flavin-binding protein dodecin
MSDTVFKKIQLVGTSTKSFSDAAANAIAKAALSESNLSWFEVIEQRGAVSGGKIHQFQVTLSVGAKLE